jgi:hypothetical protein
VHKFRKKAVLANSMVGTGLAALLAVLPGPEIVFRHVYKKRPANCEKKNWPTSQKNKAASAKGSINGQLTN